MLSRGCREVLLQTTGYPAEQHEIMMQRISDYVDVITGCNPDIALADFQLRPPIEQASLYSTLTKLGLPTKMADILYSEYDGQEYGALKLFGEFAMLTFEESVTIYKDIVSFAEHEMGHSADRRIRGETIWRKNWFPFAWDQNNNDHLCLDFDPTDAGTIGQVIYCPRWGNLFMHGASFPSFLNCYFEKLDKIGCAINGEYPDEFNCRVNPLES